MLCFVFRLGIAVNVTAKVFPQSDYRPRLRPRPALSAMPNAPRQTKNGWTSQLTGCNPLGEAIKHSHRAKLQVKASPGSKSLARD
jgi:hypothetical protein